MDQPAKNFDLRKRALQDMVDGHARMGFQDSQIKTHLREQHGVLPTEVIPPPTKSAQRARERFFATGGFSATGVVDVAGMKMTTMVSSSEASSRPAIGDDSVPLPPFDFSQERAQKVMDEVAAKHGISSPTVKINELRERTWRDSEVAFFSTVYRGTGPTLLDRMIHGFSALYRELDFGPGSNFEVFRECIVGRADKGKFDPTMLSADFAEDWNIHKAIDVSLHPWFKAGCETINIQIDAEMAEIFLAGKAPASDAWVKEFLTKPVYIDMHEKVHGQRTVSGIFCRPAPSLGTFSYMAVIEWIGQGYEAFVFGEYGKPDAAVVMYPGDEDDEGLTQEALKAIYDPIPRQVEKIAAMSYMYCRTKLDARQPIVALTCMPRAGTTSATDKKERNKEKTHSYFRVMRLDIPADRFGFTGKSGKSWSLDHLVSVAGHFRWQPYGKDNNLRKLIWIDSYEKGQGVTHRPADNPILFQIPTVQVSANEPTEDDDGKDHPSYRP
jgi:hypothetical protein